MKGNTQHISEQLDVTDVLKERGDLLGFSPLNVQLTARYIADAAQVDGELEMDVEMPCSRCLKPVHEHLTIPFHEAFVKKDAEHKEEDEDSDFILVEEDKVDLTEYLIQDMLLSLPFVPLCDEDCKGLCPVCGVDRNETPCECRQEKIDPRLAGLADFFKQE
ncbi:YceD family protein [Paenibacillus thalictri]|nr:YceD family protein [Paenibacillus thalictri]